MKKNIHISIFKTIYYTIISLIRENSSFVYPLPKYIKKYVLIHEIKKEHAYNYAYRIGLYKKNAKKYFIKYWKFSHKDLNYFYAINEYEVSNFLHSTIQGKKILSSIPKPVEIVKSDYLAIVFDYIPAENLSLKNPEIVQKKCIQSLNIIDMLNKALTKKQKEYLPHKKIYTYVITLFLITGFLSIIYPSKMKKTLRGFISCILNLHKLGKFSYKLAHRDLDSTNILYQKGHIYITDWETAAITLPLYDLVRMSILEKIILDKRQLTSINSPMGIFLKNFILLHLAASTFKNKRLGNSYLQKII